MRSAALNASMSRISSMSALTLISSTWRCGLIRRAFLAWAYFPANSCSVSHVILFCTSASDIGLSLIQYRVDHCAIADAVLCFDAYPFLCWPLFWRHGGASGLQHLGRRLPHRFNDAP